MNEAMLKMLQGVARLYPHKLEQQYPRIFEKLIELWDSPQLDAYFNELMMNTREGRQGFPIDVANEIYYLSQVRERTRNIVPKEESLNWANIELAQQRIIERSGYECSPTGYLKSVESGNREAVTAFIISGADINLSDERGWTPLMISSFNGNEEIAQLLISNGANIAAKDKSGYTPIHWAAFNGFTNVVKLLIVKHADLNAQSQHGWTALLQAATRGHLATCVALIAGGADINLGSHDGWTPLHKACANGHFEIAKLLLNAKANRDAEQQAGVTPLFLATKNNHQAIVDLLQ
jgi:ankyrin repeat protein